MLYPMSAELNVSSTGNVDIGTTVSSVYKLHIVGEHRHLLMSATGANSDVTVHGEPTGAGGLYLSCVSGGEFISFSNSGGETMRIDAVGNVGIGTHTPNAMLDVAGSASIDEDLEVADRVTATEVHTDDLSTTGGVNPTYDADFGSAYANNMKSKYLEVIYNATCHDMDVVSPNSNVNGILRAKYTGSDTSDTPAVSGISEPTPYYGIGGKFVGGYTGVQGWATMSGDGQRFGGWFEANGGDNYNCGVYGRAYDPDHAGYGRGVWGWCSQQDGYAGYFSGDAHVTGSLSKGGGSFKIDHPLDPENKYLYHSFVESPEMMNVYNGNALLDANGEAWVELPDWFETLNRDFRYQLTCIAGLLT